jgi:hypothetical protein
MVAPASVSGIALQASPGTVVGDGYRFRDRRRAPSPEVLLGPALLQAVVQIVR